MKLASRSELLFSVKSFTAAMLSVYISLRIGLPRPFWAMMTAYIVAAPFAGPTRSKGLYRAGGTIVGAVIVTFLVPRLVDWPELLSLALALWIGACLYVSLLDRTPRSYLLILSGYTAAVIAFPAVNDAGAIFDISLARVEEILLGIGCATLVHSLVLPQPFGPVLLARMDQALRDAGQWIGDALKPGGDARTDGERRKLAADITELRMMSTHLPFDTSQLRWTEKAVQALQERLAQFVPVVSSIEDRLAVLRALGADALARHWGTLLADIGDLPAAPADMALATQGAALHRRIDALAPAPVGNLSWTGLVELNLAARLRGLVDLCVDTRSLRHHIDAGLHDGLPQDMRHLPRVTPAALHRDRGMALLSAAAAVVAVLLCCAIWILTSWPAGAIAPMFAAILCSFFATQDDPVPFIKSFLMYTLLSIPVSGLYLLVLLPAVHSFEILVLVCAPVFLAIGVLLARPATVGRAMPFFFGVAATLAMVDTKNADLATFLNTTLAECVGMCVAGVCIATLRRVGTDRIVRRLLEAGWRDLARIGRGERMSEDAFAARMVDRVGLLTQRLAQADLETDVQATGATGALRDLRVGLNMTLLQQAQPQLGGGDAALQPVMAQLARRFELLPAIDAAGDAQLLEALDVSLRAVSREPPHAMQRETLAALAGMRRDLFPAAAAYLPHATATAQASP